MATFYDLAAANRRKSALLVLLVIGIFAALATAAGVAPPAGASGATEPAAALGPLPAFPGPAPFSLASLRRQKRRTGPFIQPRR